MTRALIASEDSEHRVLISWLRIMGIPHHHSVNEMWTSSYKQKRRNKAMGQAKGFPDLIIAIPQKLAINDKGIVLAVELKRLKGSVTSPEQLYWVELFNETGVPAKIAKGAQEAMEFIGQYLVKDTSKDVF